LEQKARLFQLSGFKLPPLRLCGSAASLAALWGESPTPPCGAVQLLEGFLAGSWRGVVPMALSGKEKSQSTPGLQEGWSPYRNLNLGVFIQKGKAA